MAISTAKTYLNYYLVDTFVKLVDIVSYPDLGGTPSKIDTTDLSALLYKTNILGLQEAPDLTFEANYDKTVYDTIFALAGIDTQYQVIFGTAGAEGTFTWTGQASIYVTGGTTDEARKMTITISSSTAIVKS